MPERNWKRSKERIRFRRKCSGQFNNKEKHNKEKHIDKFRFETYTIDIKSK